MNKVATVAAMEAICGGLNGNGPQRLLCVTTWPLVVELFGKD